MTDLQLMIELQRQNRDTLGFIPASTLEHRYANAGTYLISVHRTAGKIGFVIFGRPQRDRALYIHQTCLQLDHRRNWRAADLVDRIRRIATAASCAEIRLRCAVDNEANAFWLAIGARRLRTTAPRTPGSRALHHYAIYLDTDPHPLFSSRSTRTCVQSASDFSAPASSSAAPSDGSSLLLPGSTQPTSTP